MFKPSLRIAAAAIAAALTSSAQAEAVYHDFSYTGFFHEEAGQFQPNAWISGQFISDDINANGVVERSEVSSFILNGQEYAAGCGPEVFMCGLWEFSYTPGGALNFYTTWSTDPWGEFGVAAGTARSGVQVKEYSYGPGHSASYTLTWTEDTLFEISPVPEPATYGMLALGLGVLAWRSRRLARPGARDPVDQARLPATCGARHA